MEITWHSLDSCLELRNCCSFYSVLQFSSVQSLSCVQLFATPWIAAHQASLSVTNSRSSLRLTSIESVMPSSHPILCRPLLLLPLTPPSIRVFPMSQLFAWGGQSTGVSALASFLPKKSQLISFRMDWLDLLAVQGTLKSLLQHHSSKASILWRSAFFTIRLSHPYILKGSQIQTFLIFLPNEIREQVTRDL